MKGIILATVLTLGQTLGLAQTHWKAISGSISFSIKNMGSTVRGSLSGLNTSLIFSPDKLASSSLRGAVSVGTIKTGNSTRDNDLQDEKYFNTAQYKVIEIASTKIAKRSAQYTGTFNVTIKGVTKQMEIPFEFLQRGNQAEFRARFTINRRDFGVGSKSGMAMTMGDNVQVSIDIKARS